MSDILNAIQEAGHAIPSDIERMMSLDSEELEFSNMDDDYLRSEYTGRETKRSW